MIPALVSLPYALYAVCFVKCLCFCGWGEGIRTFDVSVRQASLEAVLSVGFNTDP